MKVWGSISVPRKIEFFSYLPEHHDQVLEIIRNTFFKDETVSRASEIYGNEDAENDLLGLCIDILQTSSVSIVAVDVEMNKLVGVALNLIQVHKLSNQTRKSLKFVILQVKSPSTEGSTYFEIFRDKCKTENAKSLMNYMIEADSRVDLFEAFDVDALLEIMFLAVPGQHRGYGLGVKLVEYSVELARDLKNGKDREKFLAPSQPPPKLVAALWTGRAMQAIGRKQGFEVIFKEPFSNFSFKGRNFAERVGDLSLEQHVAARKI